MKNREKIGKGNPPKHTRFSSTNQPENTGRKPKLLRHVNDELKLRGFEPVKPSHITEAFETLLNLPIQEIQELEAKAEIPYFLRIICKSLTSGETEREALDKLLDRAIGKPKQSIDHTSGGDKILSPLEILETLERNSKNP